MTPERWEQINKLYYAALQVEATEREHFLEESCQGDVDLRTEVETLLATHEKAGEFLGNPAIDEVARQVAEEPSLLVGRQLGPYQVLDLLGKGGMGEVYRAHDARLNRDVAVKFCRRSLPPIPSAWDDSNARRSCWLRSITQTSPAFTGLKRARGQRPSSWSWRGAILLRIKSAANPLP